MAISKKLKAFYMNFWDIPELFVANRISDFQEVWRLRKSIKKKVKLTEEQKKAIREFWKPYTRISPKWCQYYSAQNGIFDPRYIPNTLYYTKIDQYFNSRKLGYGFNDKNYYSRIFPDIRQPRTIVRKIGALLFDAEYNLIDTQTAMSLLAGEREVIVKPSQESGSGRDITFFQTEKDGQEMRKFLDDPTEKDYIVQEVVKQHSELCKIYANALNTIRVTTVLLDEGVHVLSCVLRMGSNNSRVDNASNGGISVGIQEDGTLKKYGHVLYAGTATEKHPQGFVFEGFRVPQFEEIIATVKKAAQYTGNFRLVSWDMAVNEHGEVLLVEANMRKGGIAIHQFNNGPMFGDLTERILDEVFKK